MEVSVSGSVEKRARSMFENSRRGAQLFVQWLSLTPEQRNNWRNQAMEIERVISNSLKTEA